METDPKQRGVNSPSMQRLHGRSDYAQTGDGGSELDAFWIKDADTTKELANKGQLADLTEYIERDRRDIAFMLLMGTSSREMESCYVRITLKRVVVAASAGTILGLVLASIAIPLLSHLDASAFPALQSYVTNFSLHVPVLMLIAMVIAMLLSASVSLHLSLRKALGSSLRQALLS